MQKQKFELSSRARDFVDYIQSCTDTKDLKRFSWNLVCSRLQGEEFDVVRATLLKRFDQIKELDGK